MENQEQNLSVENQTQLASSRPPKITRADFDALESSKQGQVLYWTKTIALLLLSSFLVAFAAYSLITPNNFTIGGISGIAILVNVKYGIPQYIILFAVNLPLIVVAFFFIKKKFALLSAANILLQTLWLALIEEAFPDFQIVFGSGGEKIFAAIASGVCIGAALAFAFKIGGSTGGADILAVIIQRKYSASSIARMLFIINSVIIGSSVFVFYQRNELGAIDYGLTLLPIMMSVFESYIESKTNESIADGFQSAMEFRIITDKPDEIASALMKQLSRGVTAIPATGMYTKVQRTMLLCVVSRRQAATLRKIVKQIDPDSFAVTSKASQVLGLGFHAQEL